MNQDELQRRRDEDFNFFVLAHFKGDPGIYELLRDRELDAYKGVSNASELRLSEND